jgi:hypothetical protein
LLSDEFSVAMLNGSSSIVLPASQLRRAVGFGRGDCDKH